MRTFIDDEAGYMAWVKQNPRGYVVNCERTPGPNYLILHHANCKTINGKPALGKFWTDLYIKVCSMNLRELEGWAKKDVGGELRECKICHK
jgi:hypothetical protein